MQMSAFGIEKYYFEYLLNLINLNLIANFSVLKMTLNLNLYFKFTNSETLLMSFDLIEIHAPGELDISLCVAYPTCSMVEALPGGGRHILPRSHNHSRTWLLPKHSERSKHEEEYCLKNQLH